MILDLEAHLLPEFGVQVGKRLVQKHDLGIDGDKLWPGYALLLSPPESLAG
jgi:hypothetical protein